MWKIMSHARTIVLAMMCVCARCTEEDSEDPSEGFEISCDGGPLEMATVNADSSEESKEYHRPQSLRVNSCVPPIGSYAAALQAMNINVAALGSLSLVDTAPGRPLRHDHFVGLSLKDIQIETVNLCYELRGPFSEKGYVDLTAGDELKVECFEDTFENMSSIPTIHPVRANHVTISMCPPPIDSYASMLQALNIDLAIFNLTLSYFPKKSPPLLARHFFNISIVELRIKNQEVIDNTHDLMHNAHKMDLERNFLEPLGQMLKVLEVRNMRLPPLPESTRIVKATLSDGVSTSDWGGCSELQKLEVSRWIPGTSTAHGWLAHCPVLSELSLSRLPEHYVRRALSGAKRLTALRVNYCDITQLSETMLADAERLTELDLSNNKLMTVDSETFKSLKHLRTLDLSGNYLWDSEQTALAQESMPALRTLVLDDNPQLDYCQNNVGTENRPPLNRLSLRRTNLVNLCFGSFDSLAHLDLAGNRIKTLQLQELPSPQTHPLVVDFSNSTFKHLPSTQMDYEDIVTKFKQVKNVTIMVDLKVDCDCKFGWITRALRSLPHLSMVGAVCSNGEHLYNSSIEFIKKLECKKFSFDLCTMRRAWVSNGTTANCQGVKPKLEMLLGIQNRTDIFEERIAPETLLSIDLRDNGIAHVSPAVANALFAVKERRVQLAGNPLVCDCDNEPLLAALSAHRSQVDYDHITCVDDGRPLRNVDLDDLCAIKLWPVIALLALICVVLSIAATFYRRYERCIKAFLYSHGYCLSCLHEGEIDTDRYYDAFISFCHSDYGFVDEYLLPGLSCYKLCIHYRDWVAGEYIPAQIARSIEESRRTVIVLSRRFLDSIWGLLEFRMAYASTLEEGRARIIVVVLDDVLEDPRLDAELRSYLATNTYVRWGEPWFWRKLRYALPHRHKEDLEDARIE